MANIKDLVAERQKTHGKYEEHADCTQKLKSVMQSFAGWHQLSPAQKECLDMINHKVGRILSGDPNVEDHWDDIEGYAHITARDIRRVKSENGPKPNIIVETAQVQAGYSGNRQWRSRPNWTAEEGGHI